MGRWVEPTLETRYHIDLEWWKHQGRSLRVFLHSHLCKECKKRYPSHQGTEVVDWVDPETGEVRQVDGLWQALRVHCARQPEFITPDTPLLEAVFRMFLANGNVPMSVAELAHKLGRYRPEVLLRTLQVGSDYYGIRPVVEAERRVA